MKKLTAILLAVLTAASLCACGSDGGSDSKADSKKSDNTAKSETDASGQEEGSGESKKTYTEYEDLSTYERIPSNPGDDEEPYSVYISTPPWRSQNEYGRGLGTAGNMGYTIYDSYDYSLIIAYDNDEVYSGDVKDILPVTFPGFIDLVGCVNASYYDKDLLPEDLMGCVESQEVVELDCGEKAVKFSGMTPEIRDESYTIKPVPVYGYSFVYNEDINITVGYEIKDEANVPKYEDMLTDIVDRMVKTIRAEQE